jgi:hypothetical protein
MGFGTDKDAVADGEQRIANDIHTDKLISEHAGPHYTSHFFLQHEKASKNNVRLQEAFPKFF